MTLIAALAGPIGLFIGYVVGIVHATVRLKR